MERSFIGFDLGAGSGRAMLGSLEGGRLRLEGISGFPNRMIPIGGHLHWDVNELFSEIKCALAECATRTGSPESIGIDTWGVDFALLNGKGDLLGLPHTYRDGRTEGAIEAFTSKVPRERVYELTGIQLIPFNTLFQLFALARDDPGVLDEARDLLFMPDLFNFFLTGRKASEFTFATTSQLFNPGKADWEDELFDALGVSRGLMQEIAQPGTVLGSLGEGICAETGMDEVPVIAVASHDTASAVAAVPAEGDGWAYISSGTWSLLGIEVREPIINQGALRFNFTSEGGLGGTYRFLKNISGLWLLQRCREEWERDGPCTYEELVGLAESAAPLAAVIDPDHPALSNPPSMPEAIAGYCRASGQEAPEGHAGIVRAILESLALRYREVLEQLRAVYPGGIERIHVVGGGSRNSLLCRFTADATGLPVIAGPAEATAVGNVMAQAMAAGCVSTLSEIREVIRRSFELETYEPGDALPWDAAYERFIKVKGKIGRSPKEGK